MAGKDSKLPSQFYLLIFTLHNCTWLLQGENKEHQVPHPYSNSHNYFTLRQNIGQLKSCERG